MFDLSTTRLRSNPLLKLISFDAIEPRERNTFENLKEEVNFYGLLVPPASSALPVKSVSRDAALLFLTLREPASVPHLLMTLFGSECQNRVRELVLDGIFEVERGTGFVSGAAALDLWQTGSGKLAPRKTAQLSADALTYAAALDDMTVQEIALRLYLYNRAPASPALQRRFENDENLLSFLVDGTAAEEQLRASWVRETVHGAWLMWRRTDVSNESNFKLYISPVLCELPHAFQAAVDAFRRTRCAQFKIGRTAFGLLRADKFVAYFPSLEQLRETADLICSSIMGIQSQGVPFTAGIDPDGLLSWGMDPPPLDQVLPGQEHKSWRQWLSERLAIYTVAAKESTPGVDPSSFVLERVRLDGIDTSTWTPNLSMWRGWSDTLGDSA
jgi:hypothetical protein